ncbi:hypothetical protein [Streptomyces sp. NPDC004284]|uniref:hypothetical protein n=1 Tax=Streptomyces sp. NPDC004284 TaxID=3364695 RepID=UPI0036CD5D10
MTAGPGTTRPHPAGPAPLTPPAPEDPRDPYDPFAEFVDELNAGLRRSALRLRTPTPAPTAAPAPRDTAPAPRPVDETAFTPALGLLRLGAKRLPAPAAPRRATGPRAA